MGDRDLLLRAQVQLRSLDRLMPQPELDLLQTAAVHNEGAFTGPA